MLDFCKSGYITEAEILKIRASEGEYKIPNHVVSKILLKGKRRYYSDEASNVKNVFHAEIGDELPNPFVRLAILQWLKERRSEYGANRTKGFHQVSQLLEELQEFGFAKDRILAEVRALAESECVGSENQSSQVEASDLVTILPAGFVHLDLVTDVNYLSAVAEDVLFDSKDAAKGIADNMVGRSVFPADSRQAALSSAVQLLAFLKRYQESHLLGSVRLVADVRTPYMDMLKAAQEKVDRLRENDKAYRSFEELLSLYPVGAIEAGQVVSVQHYGFFVDFSSKGHGLVHKSNFNGIGYEVDVGEWVLVEVLKYDHDRRRFDLKLLDR